MWRAARPAIRKKAPEPQERLKCILTGDLFNRPLRSSFEYDSNSPGFMTFWSNSEFTINHRQSILVNSIITEEIMSENRKLYLYEALELRAEYDARIKTFKDCLPETKQNRDRWSFSRDDDGRRRRSPDFEVADVRRQLRDHADLPS